MSSVLALDCSSYVGWAFFSSAGAKPKCKTWVKQGLWNSDDYAPYFLEFEKWLEDMLTVFSPDVVAFESPIVVGRGSWGDGRGNDENNIRRLIGIVSVAELVAARRNLRRFEVHNQTAKSFMGIPGRKPSDMSKKDYKDLMTIEMAKRGYECADDHQSDAAAVALVVYDMLGET